MLPASLRQRLIEQAAAVEGRWQKDVRRGGGFAPGKAEGGRSS
jgi:hypothetical protein